MYVESVVIEVVTALQKEQKERTYFRQTASFNAYIHYLAIVNTTVEGRWIDCVLY